LDTVCASNRSFFGIRLIEPDAAQFVDVLELLSAFVVVELLETTEDFTILPPRVPSNMKSVPNDERKYLAFCSHMVSAHFCILVRGMGVPVVGVSGVAVVHAAAPSAYAYTSSSSMQEVESDSTIRTPVAITGGEMDL